MSQGNVFGALREAWRKECEAAKLEAPDVWYCHRALPNEQNVEILSGLRALVFDIAQQHSSEPRPPPILLVGEHRMEELRRWAQTLRLPLDDLFGWPGLRYLPFGADPSQIVEACRQASVGSDVPIPPALHEYLGERAHDVIDASLHVRHWLQNRLRSTLLSVAHFQSTETVSSAYLRGQEAMSLQQREMVDRLFRIATSISVRPEMQSVATKLRGTIAKYETAWEAVEVQRTVLRSSAGGAALERAEDAFKTEMAQVVPIVEIAIAATRELDDTLASSLNMKDCV